MATAEIPYRDHPDDIESAPLLVDEQAEHEATVTMGEGQGTTAPTGPSEEGTTLQRRRFNFILFHRITLVLAVLVVASALSFEIFQGVAGRRIGYHIPYYFERAGSTVMTCSFITIAFAGLNLYRYRNKMTPLPMVLGTALHGLLTYFMFWAAAVSSNGVDFSPTSRCWGSGGGYNACVRFARVFWWFLLAYVVVLFVLFILHFILFVACLVATYRTRTWSGGSEHGFALSGGQISIEFSARFLRQDAPPPASIQGVPRPPPPPVPAAATTPPVQLISTD